MLTTLATDPPCMALAIVSACSRPALTPNHVGALGTAHGRSDLDRYRVGSRHKHRVVRPALTPEPDHLGALGDGRLLRTV